MSTTCPDLLRQPRHSNGFALVSAIFILVVLAALAGFIVSVTTTQSLSFAQDIQGARAYQAARAGTEIGLARWLGSTPSAAADCAGVAVSVSLTGTPLAGFDVTLTPTPTTSAGVQFCTLTARAWPTGTTAGSLGFVEREIKIVAEGNP